VIGLVTSCSIDSDGYQLGQVYLHESSLEPNTEVAVFCGSARVKSNGLSGLTLGAKVVMPEKAVILTRFPSKK
jgi:glycine hydroxymethyltransferase